MNILEILKSPHTIATAIFGLIVLGVVLFGPRIGLTGSLQWIVLAFLVVLFVLVQIMIGMMRKKKNKASGDIETSLVNAVDSTVMAASAEDKQTRQAAREELLAIIAALKETKLPGGQSGQEALSVLPWYLVLGPERSGKSTMITNSGLQLPGAGTPSGIKSLVNCDWWFTNQAIILEAERRFLGNDPDTDRDWRTFLGQLLKIRPGIPLNGIILTLPADELLQWGQERLAALAGLLRERLDAVDDKLQSHVPIYVMVTKTDQLDGFGEFFADLDTAPRNQVFGCTIPAAKMQSDDPAAQLHREFDVLYKALYQRRVPRLIRERDETSAGRIFVFPLAFRRLRDQLGRFIADLCRPNPYGSTPSFRGFYFTSSADPTTGRKPHFLKGFFLRTLIPDFRLARPTAARISRQNLRRLILRSAGFTLLGVIGLLLVVSFSRNLNLIATTREIAESAAHIVPARSDVHGIDDALVLLDRLRLRLEELDRHDKFRSPTLGLGLYRGQTVNNRAREIYIDRLVTILLGPSRTMLEEQLLRESPTTPEQYEGFEARYRAYRILVDPLNGDPELLSQELQDLWSDSGANRAASDRLLDLIDAHVSYAWHHRGDVSLRSAALTGLNRDLIARSSRFIRESWKPERFYANAIADINTRVAAYSLAEVHGATDVLMTRTQEDWNVANVPGAYTLEGWQSEVRTKIENSDRALREDWILRDVFADQDVSIMGWLTRRYAEGYLEAWAHFLGSVDLVPTGSVQSAGRQVWDLAGKDSPFVRILEDAKENLRFGNSDLSDDEEAMEPLRLIEAAAGALHALFEKKDDVKPLDTVLADLKKVAGEMETLQDADDLPKAAAEFTLAVFSDPSKDSSAIHGSLITIRQHVSRAPDGAQDDFSNALRTYLGRPAQAAWRSALSETGSYINRRWHDVVYSAYEITLKDRYPLVDAGSDASLDDYAGFFGPTGALWKFVNAELAPYTRKDWQAAIIYGYGMPLSREARNTLNRADRIKRALFTGELKTPMVKFSVEAMQVSPPPGTNYVVSQSMLWLGNKRLRYDMGRSRTMDFTWPDEQESVEGRVGVALQERAPEPLDIEASTWTIFRLLDQAKVEQLEPRIFRVTWTLRRTGEYDLDVPYKLRARTSTNPFSPDFLRFSCPQRVTAN